MRNFKKGLSLVLAVIMVMSTMTVAFAAEATTTEDKAAVLYVLRLLDGMDDDAAYTPALEEEATREQTMKLIAVAFGWEIDMDAVSVFTDVADWAQPYVKVATDMGVTDGYDIDAGIFGGEDSVTPRQIKTFFDRMLTGSETAWEDNADLSEEPATRGDLIDAMWDALMSTKTGEEAPLINGVLADAMDTVPTREVEGVEGATYEEVATMAGLYVAPALTVMTIAAVNKTTVKVDFDNAVDSIANANVKVMVGEEEKVVETAVLNAAGTTATITVPDLAYGDNAEVTLTGLEVGGVALEDVTATVEILTINDYYELVVTSDDADAKIKSDGATKTMLTASLIEKATGEVVTLDGVVNFAATKGGLAQTEVTLEEGKANVQLTSAASDASVVSYITVTIVDAPAATEYEGVTTQFEVIFAPDAAEASSTTFVQVQSAESNQGDRLFVTYSDSISASAYKAALTSAVSATTTWAQIAGTSAATITIDGRAVRVDDILQKAPTVLEFVLDTDGDGADDSADHNQKLIQSGWAAGAEEAYLRDNALHTLTVPANVGNLVLANNTGVKFIMTDAKKPFIYGVDATNQIKFTITFSESMSELSVEGARDAINPNFLIDGKKVRLTTATTGASATEITNAATNNEYLVTDLYVGSYNGGTGADTRNVVTFVLDLNTTLKAGPHVIQIANVSDWAGEVDVNNVVTTQTFDFTVAADTSKPVPTLTMQSPEQWVLAFNELVTLDDTSAEAFEIYNAVAGNDKYVDGTEYMVSDISTSSQTIYLIEFMDDWTVEYQTKTKYTNYWTSTVNPYQVKILAGEVQDLLGNVADAETLTVTLPIDVTSPEILAGVDKNTLDSNVNQGEVIVVTMNEPVQIELDTTLGGTPSSAAMTPSQQQQVLGGTGTASDVPQPTFEFVKDGKTVEGKLTKIYTKEDMKFDVTPDVALSEGTWILYIRNLTDDVGNAYNTQSYPITVLPTTTTVTGTAVSWVAFDDGADDLAGGVATTLYDYIYIKFTKAMDPTGAAGVSRTTNYVFNGVALPAGSQVYAGIKGVTNGWDGVTIQMPRQAFIDSTEAGTALSHTSVLNVASNFKAADDEALSAPYEVELTDTGIFDVEESARLVAATDAATNDYEGFEALYVNSAAANVLVNTGRKQVETATFTTATGGNFDNAVIRVTDASGNMDVTVDLDDETVEASAAKIRAALAADAAVSAKYSVSGTGAAVVLTAKTAAADDVALEITVNAAAGALAIAGGSVDTHTGAADGVDAAITGAEAYDDNADGSIDALRIYTSTFVPYNGQKVVYAGKTFVATGEDTNPDYTLFTYAGTDIATTASAGQNVTSTAGALIIDTNLVVDKAVAQITGVKIVDANNDGQGEVELTFSEAIDDATVVAAEFTYGGVAATGIATGTANDNKITLSTFAGNIGTGAADLVYGTAGTSLDDLSGLNKGAIQTVNAVDVTDSAKPVFLAVNTALGIGPVTLTFSEDVTSSALVLSDFAGSTVNGVAITALTAAADAVAGTTIVTNNDLAPAGLDTQALVLTLTSTAAGKITDAAGNTVNTTVLSRVDADMVD